ncbi:transmembrane protein 33 [Parasteatoda tepidariorum]|nr:transmembrane protein 33 [Parasteatoda tepidariorum]XP_042896377.1 transmembrane protein 33 [Parasteatoda tepidariorum]XP_042896378.1 transmembrane protein 33 [Parasteatoda tepidariorum]XP_042896379.1 transmembrane protein 33 [Parasteatoda tepidariorum]
MSTNGEERTQAPPESQSHGFQAAMDYMMLRKVDALLWLTRIGTMVFTILSMIPIFGVNPYTSYQRALMSNAATSALRLHQRLPRVQLTREFGATLLMEDSCHYLLYSILFIISYPITLSLLPIFLFAVLHSVHFSIIILNKLGHYNTWATTSLTSIAENHQRNILRLVAFTEVTLMPLTILWLFSGKGSLFTPFAYYRFLTFRYASRRNPYCRNVFHEMKILLQNFASKPGRNVSIRNFCLTIIRVCSYFAPPIVPQQ